MSSAALQSCVVQSLTTSNGQSDACQNPFCKSIIEPLPDGWRRTKRALLLEPLQARRLCATTC